MISTEIPICPDRDLQPRAAAKALQQQGESLPRVYTIAPDPFSKIRIHR